MTLWEQIQHKSTKLQDLGYDELYELYVVEQITDEQIADVCNCTKGAVRNKRHRLRVYFSDITILKCNQYGVYPTESQIRTIKINNNEKV